MSDANVYSDGSTTVLLAGVGGQGTILAADLLAKTAIANGLSVKLSEIHGMSQRGGSVTTVVRLGKTVNSMVCGAGSADYLLSFETTEALRNLPYLKRGGLLLVNDASIKPLPVLTGKDNMPKHARERLLDVGATLVPARRLACQAGSVKCANVVLLGALAAGMPFAQESWEGQIRLRVPPKTIDMNIEAFRLGMEAVQHAE
ncbi:indolepyruvate oxidoreductase subunit beta [Curtanaerobium respiraculi]|uniref:indolepyruvate oxidoreductase subunit beta n=1 Tax=Curtanaerobium respiraculi TaxID=2949669 RepID=UPI0024B363FA|nr:indolepyruvate oxidoreductase subunit beta [Curtanaerobium respiraculi]